MKPKSPIRLLLQRSALAAMILVALHATAHAKEAGQIAVETLVKSTQSWNGDTLPPYPAGQPEVTILRITIPAGQRLPMHEHTVINAGVLLKGELRVTMKDGQTKDLKAGDPLIELVDQWHYGENFGTEDAQIVVVYAGIEGKPNTVEQE